jgi:hypothetical protein
MWNPGNIKLPLQVVWEIGYNEIETLDFLFDMHIPNLCDILNEQVKMQIPGLAVVRSTTHHLTALVYFKPQAGIRLFEGQKYLIFVAHDLDMLMKYFKNWSECNEDIYLTHVLSNICNVLRDTCKGPMKIKFRTEAI